MYCTIEAMTLTTDRYEASRGLFAIAELLVMILDVNDMGRGVTCKF